MAWVTKTSEEPYPEKIDAPEKEYTKMERAANWWDYHKWQVIIGVVAAVALVFFIKDTVFQTKPDYQVAWVGEYELPVDTAEALKATLEGFCDDKNGDGKVVVQLNQYTVDFNSETEKVDAYGQMAGITRLSADIASGSDTYLFLLQDPEGFESNTQALQYLDGTLPSEGAADWQNMCYLWQDCPVLAGLELGSYQGYTALDNQTGQNQDILKDVYVARRGVWDEKQAANFAGCAEIWQALTSGASQLPGAAL